MPADGSSPTSLHSIQSAHLSKSQLTCRLHPIPEIRGKVFLLAHVLSPRRVLMARSVADVSCKLDLFPPHQPPELIDNASSIGGQCLQI
nr:hypothetical protein CFP56_53736 [Quercus suber]